MSTGNPSRIAFVFPGQGSQHVGMGKDIYDSSPAARRIFADADEVLGFSMRSLCFEGPDEELTDTVNAQPAILTVSIACLEAFRERCDGRGIALRPALVAGHSLGEYSALVAAGALGFRDAVALVRERGRLMKEAGQRYPGGMAAIMGLDNATLEQVCAQASEEGIVVVANHNCPGQTVISGDNQGLQRAIELATSTGARRAVRLAITIASHSPLMQYAATHFEEKLNATAFAQASVPVVCNLTAKPASSVEEIRCELAEQVCHSVRWEQSIVHMVGANVDAFLEIGPGQVLAGLIKRISKEVRAVSINDNKSIAAGIAVLSQG
ncbi:MAG: ACP S-malonyltransferase [Chloroflexi bacterium]|nr:ACP S-malonyltransferase [Chloroflexota bacterium]